MTFQPCSTCKHFKNKLDTFTFPHCSLYHMSVLGFDVKWRCMGYQEKIEENVKKILEEATA